MKDSIAFEIAVKTYTKDCKTFGRPYQQPSENLSAVRAGTVILANSRGEIARYGIKEGRLLDAEKH